jgi:hypothetical protein
VKFLAPTGNLESDKREVNDDASGNNDPGLKEYIVLHNSVPIPIFICMFSCARARTQIQKDGRTDTQRERERDRDRECTYRQGNACLQAMEIPRGL